MLDPGFKPLVLVSLQVVDPRSPSLDASFTTLWMACTATTDRSRSTLRLTIARRFTFGNLICLKEHVPNTAVAFAKKLMDQGFEVSSKTTVVSTSSELGRLVQEELKKIKVHVKLDASGRDVGCDFVGGSRRRISLQTYRI